MNRLSAILQNLDIGLSVKDPGSLTEALRAKGGVERSSLIAYDAEDIV